MVLAASIGLAAAALGLSLMIQSRILLDPPDRLPLLGRQLRLLAIPAVPIGIILVVMGIICPAHINSFISVGVVLIILAITLLIQSQVLSVPDASLKQLGRNTRIWAYVCAVAGFLAVVITLATEVS